MQGGTNPLDLTIKSKTQISIINGYISSVLIKYSIFLHMWINQQPRPSDRDIKMILFLYLIFMQCLKSSQIHILVMRLCNIKIFFTCLAGVI